MNNPFLTMKYILGNISLHLYAPVCRKAEITRLMQYLVKKSLYDLHPVPLASVVEVAPPPGN